MVRVTRTGAGQKQNFATGSLPPHQINDCRRCAMSQSTVLAYVTSLTRHFEDLRDGTHGGSSSREDKEAHFKMAVQLLAPVSRQVLNELNKSLLLDTGHLAEREIQRLPDGGLGASWILTSPDQAAAC